MRADIIHDTTKHIHFESKKIMDSIPQNIKSKNADSTEMNGENGNITTQGNEDCEVSDTEGVEESLGDFGSILDILTAEELETPLIKDHLEALKRWQKEDSDEKFIGGKANVGKLQLGKARKTGLKQVRWFERLNSLKKSYIVTKSENILPFQLMIPRGALQTGKNYQDLKIRLKWVIKALPQMTHGNPSYIFIQPIYNQNDKNADLSQLSGYIYLRQVFKSMLRVGGLESNR